MRARDKAGLLKRSARCDVIGVAAGAGNAAQFVTDSLQLLHEETPQAAAPVWLRNFHVDVAIGAVVVIEDSSGCSDCAVNFYGPVVVWMLPRPERSTLECVSRCDLVFKDDFFADDVPRPGMQHDGNQDVVGLHFHGRRSTRFHQLREEIEST